MDYFSAIILSIVEGITEFLPVSSTGHLILTSHILRLEQTEFLKTFSIVIQLGAIFSVIILYAQKFITSKAVWLRVLAAFVPTAIIGLVLYKFIKSFLLGNEMVTLAALFLGGIVLILLELLHKPKEHAIEHIADLPLKKSVLIGVFQSLSVIPGVSRSAATIIGGLFLGMNRTTAVEFSFLLAVPTMFAATVLDLKEQQFQFTQQEITILILGMIVSCLIAFLAMKFFLNFVKTHSFIPFGIYRILIAVCYWLFLLR